jgi:xanthine dehydrogenase accessory factor
VTSYQRLAELERQGATVAVATVIQTQGSVPRHAGSRMLIFQDGSIEGTIGGGEMEHQVIQAAQEALQSGQMQRLSYSFRDPAKGDVGVCGGEMEVLVEPMKAPHKIVIIGGGHVGQSVAQLADWLGYHVVVADDREEYADDEVVPGADEVVHAPMAELAEELAIHNQTYILLTTRGVEVDLEGLPALLESKAAYIGVIGSRRRWETTAAKLRQAGVPEEKIARVTSPIGLELKAETPEEIALSMMAEIVMLIRGGSGDRMDPNPPSTQG